MFLVWFMAHKQQQNNLKQHTKGKIINACSIAGHESYEMLSTYSASKHAVRSFTQAAAKS